MMYKDLAHVSKEHKHKYKCNVDNIKTIKIMPL